MAATRDHRGHVAVVYAAAEGPVVHFVYGHSIGPTAALIDAMRITLRVYVRHDGRDRSGWPRAVWVQVRAGKWEPA